MDPAYRKYLKLALLFAFGFKAFLVLFGNLLPGGWNGWDHVFDVLARNDSGWYHLIAADWYPQTPPQPWEQTPFPFFPLYPFLLLVFLKITGGYISAALILHLGLTYIWIYTLYKYLIKINMQAKTAFVFTVLYQLFPFHYFFHSFYTEQLFSILLLWALIEIKNKRWIYLFFATFLMALCRPTGLIMSAGLAFVIAEDAGWLKLLKSRAHILLVLSLSGAVLGVITWMLYLHFHCGDALAFSHSQAAWGRHYTWPWESLFRHGRWDVQLLSTYVCVLLCITIFAMRKAKLSNKIFVALNAIFPLITGNINSYQRYFSVIIPAFESIFAMLYKRWILWACVLGAINLLTYFYWVSYSGWLSF